MSAICDCYPEFYVEFSEELAPSVGTEFCLECGRLIPCGEELYTVCEWKYGADCKHWHLGKKPCCEECGDLALSWLELGFCWSYGKLRNDIAELHEYFD